MQWPILTCTELCMPCINGPPWFTQSKCLLISEYIQSSFDLFFSFKNCDKRFFFFSGVLPGRTFFLVPCLKEPSRFCLDVLKAYIVVPSVSDQKVRLWSFYFYYPLCTPHLCRTASHIVCCNSFMLLLCFKLTLSLTILNMIKIIKIILKKEVCMPQFYWTGSLVAMGLYRIPEVCLFVCF